MNAFKKFFLASFTALVAMVVWLTLPAQAQTTVIQFLRQLRDVRLPAAASISDGQALVWNASLAVWTNGTVSAGGGATNGIQMLNGQGTNTTILKLTANGTNFFFENYAITLTVSNGITSYGTTTNLGTNDAALSRSLTNAVTNVLNVYGTGNVATANSATNNITNTLRLAFATASRLMIVDSQKNATNSAVTDTEAGYLSGVTSAIQTQLDAKALQASLELYAADMQSTNASVGGGILPVDCRTNAAGLVLVTPGANCTLTFTNAPLTGIRQKTVTVKFQGDGTDRTVTFGTKAGAQTLTNRFGAAHVTSFVVTNNQHVILTVTFPPNAANNTDFTNAFYALSPNIP